MVRGVGEAVIRDVNRLFAEGTAAGASDEQLLSRYIAARDRSSLAFEAIVRRHGPMVLETCRRLLDGDHHAAEDAFQATFLVLARRADSIVTHASGSLGPWLHEVACRTARKARIERFRHEKRDLRAARIMLRSSTRPWIASPLSTTTASCTRRCRDCRGSTERRSCSATSKG